MDQIRQVIAYKNYFLDFYHEQTAPVRKKIVMVLQLIRVTKQIPEKFFKHIEGTKGIFEIRVEVDNSAYRIFSFFDKGNLVILGNAFQKKSQKTPKQEIKKAVNIMEEYFNERGS